MLDRLRNTINSGRRSSEFSNIGRSAVDVPAIIEPRPSTDSEPLPSYRSRALSTSSSLKPRRASSPGGYNSGYRSISRGPSNADKPVEMANPSRPTRRRRDIFWKVGLWHDKHASPCGPRVRACSQSISIPHPSVVDEQMRNMPYYDWRA